MAVYNAIPAKVLEGASILIGADKFREFVQAMVEKNFYHYDGKHVDNEIMIPGTNVKLIAVNGLNGTGKTTLFNILNKDISMDSGEIFIQKDLTIYY